jgi:hypothetical protein
MQSVSFIEFVHCSACLIEALCNTWAIKLHLEWEQRCTGDSLLFVSRMYYPCIFFVILFVSKINSVIGIVL